jgi:uncharacterized metal-binding protein
MAMANESCSLTRTVVFTCSGAANVGQIANQAAVDLQQERIATMLCHAAIGSHNEDMIALGRSADRVVGIDGCSVACTKNALEHAEVPMTDHIVVTNLSLTKKPHDGMLDANAVTRVKNAVKGRLKSVAGGQY